MDDISGNLDQHLLEAYLSTTYEVKDLGLKIKIGEENWDLEEFLVDNNVFTWAFISAYNPFSNALSFAENEGKHSILVKKVIDLNLVFREGFGIPAKNNWEPEKSLLILDITKLKAIELGKEMLQNAILFGRMGGVPELVFLKK